MAGSRKKVRFTVSLDPADYERLKALVERHHPKLTLQYAVEFAVAKLLEQANEPQMPINFGNPIGGRSR